MNRYEILDSNGTPVTGALSYMEAMRYMQTNRLNRNEYSVELFMPNRPAAEAVEESVGNVDAFIVKDRVSGVTVINDDGTPKTFTKREDADRFVRNVCHYVNTDYYVVELDAFN